MDDVGRTGAKLQAAHVAGRVDRQWDDEDAEHVRAVRWQRVGRHRDDEIGRAELPAAGKAGRKRHRIQIAGRSARVRPLAEQVDVPRVETLFADESVATGLGLPRRHVAAGGDRGDLTGPLLRRVIRRQIEWAGAAGVMTRSASAVDDRRYVFREGDPRRLRRNAGAARERERRGTEQKLHSGLAYASTVIA